MKNFLLLIVVTLGLNATEYFSKIEPYEHYTISAQSAGKVIFVDKTKEYTFIENISLILNLDTKEDEIQLHTLSNSLVIQKEILRIKEKNYKNKLRVKQLSDYNKNQEKLIWLESKQLFENLHRDIEKQKLAIEEKKFIIYNTYLGKINVSTGEYINMGMKLYELYDFSKLKAEIFVQKKELENIKKKRIFINGKESNFKVEKISSIQDSKRISTHKVVLIKENHNKNIYFGKVIKITFK